MTIRRDIFKTNDQITIAQYQTSYAAEPALANGRAGELVVDLADPAAPELYIANNTGVLTAVGGASGGGTSIVNGNSNVSVAANANVTVGVAGNAAIFTVTGTGANVAGTANITGNLVSGGTIFAANGTAGNPSYGFTYENATDTGFYWVSDGNIGVTNNGVQTLILQANTIKQTAVAFASLPAATTAGLRGFINNGNLAAGTNMGAVVTGGGSNNCPVFSDGTNWRIG